MKSFCKRALLIIPLLFAIMLTSSCATSSQPCLEVISLDYPEMKKLYAAEMDMMQIMKIDHQHNCRITLVNDNICVYDESPTNDTSHTLFGNSGCYIGIDQGEFGGWVGYVDYDGALSSDIQLLLEENCLGFVEIGATGYLFTGLAHLSIDEGAFYKIDLRAPEYNVEKIADLDGSPNVIWYDWKNKTIYFVTYTSINSFNEEEGLVVLDTPQQEYWSWINFNSIVKKGNKLYLGSDKGIFEYDIENDKSLWYPIIFETE